MNTTSAEASPEAIVIKKYANRRLYNTATSSYVTLDTLCQMVKDGTEFVVYDAKTGENITKPVLTQIIFEEEAKGQNLLPASFLRQLIRFYGDSLQALLPNYLEMSMEAFTRNQEQFRHYMTDAFAGMGMAPFKKLDEISKQNMAMFQRAMEMFNPFAAGELLTGGHHSRSGTARSDGRREHRSGGQAEPQAQGGGELDELRAQLEQLQKRFDAMSRGASPAGGSAEGDEPPAATEPRRDGSGPGRKGRG